MTSEKLVISCHQPNFLPYLGFFDKMVQSDILVIRDEVLFVKKEFHNRNRIRINSNDNINSPQSKWISVPVSDLNDNIIHVKIKRDFKIKEVFWNEILLKELKTHYQRTRYFEDYFPELEEIFDNSHESLISLNMRIINFIARAFNIRTKIILASNLNLKPKNFEKSDASQDLANICKALNGNVYFSGEGGKVYLNKIPFERENIEVEFQEYKHPVYKQNYPGFKPYMAAIDALFCVGKMPKTTQKSLKIPPLLAA